MGEEAKLRLYNTLTRTKDDFRPIDSANVRMYVCGPTVYDFAHIGNARPVIVFDVLFRLLRHLYGEDHVTYVRNITDVDDKINARARRDFPELPLNEAIRQVTETTARQFHDDVAALGCLPPTVEPRATEFVLPRPDGKADMASLIQTLIERGHAYEAPHSTGSGGEILFDTASMPDYGRLSRRNLDEQQAGARVAVDAHKKHPADFVLWKQSSAEEPGWDAEFRLADRTVTIRGRPGWHIECSAMSAAYLGEIFDIHGGGLDLIFPHHENEIAQSRCAHGTEVMANHWLHNGFLQVEGKKMAKSEGNFVTIHELLHTEKFGGRKWPGEVLRLAMLMTHYREPIDFSVRRLGEAEARISRWRSIIGEYLPVQLRLAPSPEVVALVASDLDIYAAFNAIDDSYNAAGDKSEAGAQLGANLQFLGCSPLLQHYYNKSLDDLRGEYVQRRLKEWAVESIGVVRGSIEKSIIQRLALIREKNWADADRIRDELLEQGVQLMDGRDPETGERVTTWEVKR